MKWVMQSLLSRVFEFKQSSWPQTQDVKKVLYVRSIYFLCLLVWQSIGTFDTKNADMNKSIVAQVFNMHNISNFRISFQFSAKLKASRMIPGDFRLGLVVIPPYCFMRKESPPRLLLLDQINNYTRYGQVDIQCSTCIIFTKNGENKCSI